jgi:15-cis-phytoene synthase
MSDDASDLDGLVRRVDPDRWLSSRFVADAQARADVIVVYAYDYELARAPKVASNALMGEIRLTWWREALDEIFENRPVRRHPTAEALADVVARRGLPRGPLETMIDARYRDLDPAPMTAEEALDWSRDTAGLAADLAVRVLDPDARSELATAAGAAWALGHRLGPSPDLRGAFDAQLALARSDARHLAAAAFPAVAHAVLAGGRPRGDLARRLRLTLAVALGRL